MADQSDPTQQGARQDRGRGHDSSLRYPSGAADSPWLPEIPKVVNWATALLVLGVIPWLLVFADNVFSSPAVVSGVDFPANSYGAMLLLIGYLMLAVSVLNGRKRIRIMITVVIAAVDLIALIALNSVAGPGRHLGRIVEIEAGLMSFTLVILVWTIVLSGIGLILLYTPASNFYIARSEAYQAYLDRQNVGRSPRLWLARPDRR